MRRTVSAFTVLALVAWIGACAQRTSEGGRTAAVRSEGAPAPAGTSLSKVRLGMTRKEVRGVLGEPDDENSYMTGKAFIPFYFGNDVRRTSWYYKGVGRVIFADGNVFGGAAGEVVRIDYDPSERGAAPR